MNNTTDIATARMTLNERDALEIMADGLPHTTNAKDGLYKAFRSLARKGVVTLSKLSGTDWCVRMKRAA